MTRRSPAGGPPGPRLRCPRVTRTLLVAVLVGVRAVEAQLGGSPDLQAQQGGTPSAGARGPTPAARHSPASPLASRLPPRTRTGLAGSAAPAAKLTERHTVPAAQLTDAEMQQAVERWRLDSAQADAIGAPHLAGGHAQPRMQPAMQPIRRCLEGKHSVRTRVQRVRRNAPCPQGERDRQQRCTGC